MPFGLWLLLLSAVPSAKSSPPDADEAARLRTFAASGVVLSVARDERQLVIRHGAISNYMAAMTMPFQVKNAAALDGLKSGDEISFRLQVTQTDSWIDRIVKLGTTVPAENQNAAARSLPPAGSILDCTFTNELGQPVRLNDFRGQALAVTFIYTRCPLPNACPRLSKNFEEAAQKLEALPHAPPNWHFISVSFDPEFDTPAMLKAYGESYQYDPKHWSLLTGSADKIAELARASGVEYEADGATINHSFRTLIIDTSGHLQMTFPTSGDLSAAIVTEILKAAAVTNSPASPPTP